MPRTRRSARSRPKREGRIRRKNPTLDAPAPGPLSADLLAGMDAYWRASNYLAVGQIYLFDNPLLTVPRARLEVAGRRHRRPGDRHQPRPARRRHGGG